MAAGTQLHQTFAHGLAHVLNELAGVQPDLEEPEEDMEEYAEFDGTELPTMSLVGELSAQETQIAALPAMYIEVPIEDRVIIVMVMERQMGHAAKELLEQL